MTQAQAQPQSPTQTLAFVMQWKCEAVVLLTEHRTCRCCSATYTTPAKHLMLRYRRRDGGLPATIFEPVSHPPSWLPQEHETIDLKVDRCTRCFTVREPGGQRELFPEFEIERRAALIVPLKAPSTEAKPKSQSQGKAKKPELKLTLEDF